MNQRLLDLKKRQFIENKVNLFQEIFGKGFIRLIPMDDFEYPNINSIISFIESKKIREIDYRLLPSHILKTVEGADINTLIKESINSHLHSGSIYIMYSYIFNFNEEISGFASLEKEAFLSNFHKIAGNYGFVLSYDCSEFIYYSEDTEGDTVYIYKGLIVDKRYVKILYA